MGDTNATCLPLCVLYTRTSPAAFPVQMYSPLLVAEKLQASDRPALALHPGTCKSQCCALESPLAMQGLGKPPAA